MASNVLIAGAGQLGSRYLQGLSRYMEEPLNIWVYDISPESLERARQRWEECGGRMHSVAYIEDLAEIPKKIDMAFVVTNSDVRLAIVKNIVQIATVRYWILEKVLARSISELYALVDATTGSSGVWVNTPRRLWPLYRTLRAKCSANKPIHARFSGVDGLACNAIHYIDLVSRWNQASVTSVEVAGSDHKWVPSKRSGFFELEGELAASFSDGSTLFISGRAKTESYRIEIRTDDGNWLVDENNGLAQASDDKAVSGNALLQSELIAPLLDQIFNTGRCDLPTLELSVAQHKPLLTALLAHWNANVPEKLDYVPIT